MKKMIILPFLAILLLGLPGSGQDSPFDTQKGCRRGCTVFIGDSNVGITNWQEYFTENVCNMGVGGNTTDDVFARSSLVARLHPVRVVMLVGGNDLLRYAGIDEISGNYRKLIRYYKSFCREVYCISNLPVKKDIYLKNWVIMLLNGELEKVCRQSGAVYINVYPLLYKDGGLNPRFILDELHINKLGQTVVAEEVKKHFRKK